MLQFFNKKKDKESSNSVETGQCWESEMGNLAERMSSHPYVQLARKAIERYVLKGEVMETPDPLPEDLQNQAGVFVSIKKEGRLRGCIGTLQPAQLNIAAEIIHNAISSSTQDPRFPPVSKEELGGLEVSVDIMSPPQPVKNRQDLNCKKYGVIVTRGWRRGLLLPDLEGVNSVEEQLNIARQKAGIGPHEDIEIMRFEVKRYK